MEKKSNGYNGNTKLKSENTQIEFSEDLVKEYIKCANDIIYWAEKYIKIMSVDDGIIPITLYDYQKEIIEACFSNRRILVLSSRQSGKTTIAAIIILHYTLFNDAKTVAILANKESASIEVLDRIQLAYENLPLWQQRGVKEWNKKSVVFENESKIIAASTSSSSIRGKSISFLYIDEVAFIENWEAFYASTYPAISSGKTTKMLFTSTPNGLNQYYEFWKGATEGTTDEFGETTTNGFIPIKVSYQQIPGRDEKWKEETLAALNYNYDQFSQEYNCFEGNTLLNIKNIETGEIIKISAEELYELLGDVNVL